MNQKMQIKKNAMCILFDLIYTAWKYVVLVWI